MLRSMIAALAVASAMPAVAAPPPPPVEVMVLGTYHFGNPGLDLNNIKADSVLTPERQRQLAAVAKAIAEWHPTRVMVEQQSKAPDLAVGDYPAFSDAMLASDANEIVQIGYRIAHLAGLKTVNGIDEQPKAAEPDYFPFDKVQSAAKTFGQVAFLEATNVPVAKEIGKFEALQKTDTVAQLLTWFNTPGRAVTGMTSYYSILTIGDFDNQAGADLNAAWYLRNAKIFGKLMHIARPGDRILVIYGSGHGYWLRHFANETPGYRNVDVLPYLAKAR